MAPNLIAFLALGLWPAVGLFLYSKYAPSTATIWTLLGAELLLPLGPVLKIAGVPQFDKTSIPILVIIIGCLLTKQVRIPSWKFSISGLLILMYLMGPLVTVWLNQDPIFFEHGALPGETPYDALSAVFTQFLTIIPYFLGRLLFRSSGNVHRIFFALAVAGLIYSIPMLFEVRMSPQLNFWVYGYYPTDFEQAMRDGGFRPTVFLGHGLLAAFFMMTSTVSAAFFWRTRRPVLKIGGARATGYLLMVLLFCKTAADIIYGAVLVPAVRYFSPKTQLRISIVLVSVALSYPMLRTADLVPTQALVNVAAMISPDRASSLKTRFDNEDALLARASMRWAFGWGRWGRNRVHSTDSGKDESITDGRWIITLGQFGVFGFLAEFGLLCLPIFRASSACRLTEAKSDQLQIGVLSLLVSINVFDLLPNSGLLPWTWLLAGALLGRIESILKQRPAPIAAYIRKPETFELEPIQRL